MFPSFINLSEAYGAITFTVKATEVASPVSGVPFTVTGYSPRAASSGTEIRSGTFGRSFALTVSSVGSTLMPFP
jgi:hypothetical protein